MMKIQTITRLTRLIRNIGLVIGIPMLGGVGLYYHICSSRFLTRTDQLLSSAKRDIDKIFREQMKIKDQEVKISELLRCDNAEKIIKGNKAVFQEFLTR
jgi:hypothetical protein